VPDTATTVPTATAAGVEVALDPVGAGVARLTTPGAWIAAPGAVTVLAEQDGQVVSIVDPAARWRLAEDGSPDSLVTLVAEPEPPVTPSVTATVGDFGLAVVHGVTNASDAPIRVGLAVRLHPDGGPDAHAAVCGDGHPAELDVVGADTAVVPGRPVAGARFPLEVDGGRPLPGKTHVVHRLRAPDGGERLRIWGDADFAHTRARIGDGAVELELRTVPALPTVEDLQEIGPGETWMVSWGLQPDGFAGPQS
jgi:hypothetical protein